jgi:hypothetical protein
MSLSKVYYDPKHAAGFGSVAKLVKASKNKKRNVEEWLSGQDTYTLHKPARKGSLEIHIRLQIWTTSGK